MSLFRTISCANGRFTTSSEYPIITLISTSSTCGYLTWSQSSIFPATVHHAKRITRSTTQRVLAGLMVRLSSRAGRTSILPLYQLGRWVQVLVIWPSTILGVGGIGKRSWEWVTTLFLAPPALTADTFRRRAAPSVLVEGSPHERETRVREQEV